MKRVIALCVLYALASAPAAIAAEPGLQLKHRWVYVSTNLLVDKNVEWAVRLLDRAAKAGYTGVVLTDSKFMRWDNLPDRYARNVHRVRDEVRKRKLDLIACVMPIGYSNSLLSRDPNLAEGLRRSRTVR